MSTPDPFVMPPSKPQVARLADGRIGIFVGGAYQFTDEAGALGLRDQLNDVLDHNTPPGTFVIKGPHE